MKNEPIRKVYNSSFGRAQYSPSIGAYFILFSYKTRSGLEKGL